jgi:branched-chain amino acid transport system permease protein
MEYWFGYLDQALIFGVIVVALNVLIGYAGIFSAGSAAFAAVGGYATAVLVSDAGWSTLPALAAAVVFGAVVGIVVSSPILRLSEEYVMLMTLALSILTITLVGGTTYLGGAQGIVGLPTPTFFGIRTLHPSDFTPWLGFVLVVAVAICWRISESPWGRLLRATRDNDLGVRSLGKSPLFDRILTFTLMCGLTALGGGLLVIYNGLASPVLFSLNQTMIFFAMVIVGGISSIPGSLVGALLLVALTPILETVVNLPPELAAQLRLILFGVLLVVIVRFRPVGLIRERHVLPKIGTQQELSAEESGAAEPVPVATVDRSPASAPERGEVVLEVKQLSKSFGGVKAVDDLTLQLHRGEITALIGANGAGKSTVFNLITGAIRPDAGRVLLGARDITGRSPQRVAQLGMVRSFQDLRVFSKMTPLENVMTAGGRHPGENVLSLFATPWRVSRRDRELADESVRWLDFVGLDPGIKVNTEALSFAQQKQVALARVLATRADILLLDEPLSGIEGSAADELLALVERMRTAGHTICIVEHSVQTISRLADWGYFMETGHVTAEGTIRDLLQDPRLTEAYFGVT